MPLSLVEGRAGKALEQSSRTHWQERGCVVLHETPNIFARQTILQMFTRSGRFFLFFFFQNLGTNT